MDSHINVEKKVGNSYVLTFFIDQLYYVILIFVFRCFLSELLDEET